MTPTDPASPRSLRLSLARIGYDSDMVRIADRDLTGFSHFVATRHGLFAVHRGGRKLIAYGLYFGLTFVGHTLYAFEACGDPRARSDHGRIVRFQLDGDRIADADVLAKGLANGCHQMDVVHGRLCLLDTYNQRVISYPLNGGSPTVIPLLGRAESGEWDRGYVHANSLIARGDDILVMLHNGGERTGRASEIATFDRDWTLQRRAPLDGLGCHNFAVLEDGTILSCGSLGGELIGSNGLKVKVCDMMTRGLSVSEADIAVGGSAFSTRELRDDIAGAVFFLDRDYRALGSIELPGPPLEIRRIDGRDRSLSSFLRDEAAAA